MENSIAAKIKEIELQLKDSKARLVAVSKFHPAEAIMQAYDAGQRVFGESRVQELLNKVPGLPEDIQWHFIGHLQTNKVKALLPHVSLIESIDSERLLELVDKEALKLGVTARVLMQIHVAQEETKTGFLPEELLEYFKSHKYESLKATHICGIMGMASNTEDKNRIREDFKAIRGFYDEIRTMCPDLKGFDTISMGMSGDWEEAVRQGSTLIRIGTAIFGQRQY